MCIRDRDKSAHALCGESILLNAGFSDGFCSIIGAHHGIPQDANSRKHMESYPPHYYGLKRNSQFWNSIWEEWIDFSLKKAGFSSLDEIPMLSKRTQVLLSGLLIMADWIASDQTKFNLIEIENIPDGNDYPANRFCDAIKQLALPDVWEPEHFTITEEIFRDYFSFSENEIQKNVIKAVSNCKDAGIFILEAPMGKGKTEAAFAAAEILAKKNGKTGVFIGLPTQATANGIFERTVNWAEHLSTEFYHSIRLAHSNAYFQPVFANIQKGIPQIDEDSDSGLVVHSFFNGSKQSCLADFVIGTVDQLLMCALKKKHAMLLHLGLSQKVVIIDECHAYDAYMNQYLDTALAWLSEYHVPVILLSATLPQKRRNQLINAYLRREDTMSINLKNNYPQLTYSDGKDINQWKIPESEKSIHEVCKLADPAWQMRIETSLNVSWEYIVPIIEDIDEWIIDIKDMDAEIYQRYTGVSIKNLTDNFLQLAELVEPSKLYIRVPRVKGINTEKDVEKSVECIRGILGVELEVFEVRVPSLLR